MDRKQLLERVQSPEDRRLLARVLDKIALILKNHETVVTDFFDPYQQNLISPVLRLPGISFIWTGGYPAAERQRLVIGPEYLDMQEVDNALVMLAVTGNLKYQNLAHRDFLGSILGLGIKREKIGDIIVNDNGCLVIVDESISGYIINNLTKVHRVSVVVKRTAFETLELPEEKTKEIRTTVSSLRIDAVAAAGYGVSRTKMALDITAEKVKVNWNTVSDPSFNVKEGDKISIRGRGRVEVETVKGETKKGRLSVILKRYQ